MINDDVKHYLKLDPGERLLWADRPQGLYIRRSAFVYFLIVGPFCYWLYYGVMETRPDEIGKVTIFIGILLANGFLVLLSPLVERHYLTDRRIVADFPLMRSSFIISGRTKIKRAEWAGKNCVRVSETYFARRWFLFSMGASMIVLHGVRDPNDFIRKFHNET